MALRSFQLAMQGRYVRMYDSAVRMDCVDEVHGLSHRQRLAAGSLQEENRNAIGYVAGLPSTGVATKLRCLQWTSHRERDIHIVPVH